MQLTPRCSVHNDTLAFTRRAAATDLFGIPPITNIAEEQRHGGGAEDR